MIYKTRESSSMKWFTFYGTGTIELAKSIEENKETVANQMIGKFYYSYVQ